MQRILLAGIAAGIALFLWEAVAHMATPLGMMGFRPLQHEDAVSDALRAQIPTRGLYVFPAPKPDGSQPAPGTPVGLLMFHPHGLPELTPQQFGMQLALDIAAMLLAAIVLSQVGPQASGMARFLLVVAMAFFPVIRSELPLWNWYGYPRRYIAAQMAIHVVGFAAGGLILTKLVRRPEKASAAAV
jgi:hypothetical protein